MISDNDFKEQSLAFFKNISAQLEDLNKFKAATEQQNKEMQGQIEILTKKYEPVTKPKKARLTKMDEKRADAMYLAKYLGTKFLTFIKLSA